MYSLIKPLYGFFLFLFISCSQDMYQAIPTAQPITLTKGDTIYTFSLFREPSTVSAKQRLLYTWFSKGALGHSQGAYIGKLLHGEYTVMLRNNTLLEKGSYYRGLKDGQWCHWHANGMMKTLSHYRKGMLSGSYQAYDVQGQLVQAGTYKKGLMHGRWISYHSKGEKEEKRYKKGEVVEPDTMHWKIKDFFHRNPADSLTTEEVPTITASPDSTRQKFWKKLFSRKKEQPQEAAPTGEMLPQEKKVKRSRKMAEKHEER